MHVASGARICTMTKDGLVPCPIAAPLSMLSANVHRQSHARASMHGWPYCVVLRVATSAPPAPCEQLVRREIACVIANDAC
jgi:hypothetical protein